MLNNMFMGGMSAGKSWYTEYLVAYRMLQDNAIPKKELDAMTSVEDLLVYVRSHNISNTTYSDKSYI